MAKKPQKAPTAAVEPATLLVVPPREPAPVSDIDDINALALADDATADAALTDATEDLSGQILLRAVKTLVLQLEKATKGHGADSDRALMGEAAQLLRSLMSWEETDLLAPAPFGPVKNDPPIGHSLPTP